MLYVREGKSILFCMRILVLRIMWNQSIFKCFPNRLEFLDSLYFKLLLGKFLLLHNLGRISEIWCLLLRV